MSRSHLVVVAILIAAASACASGSGRGVSPEVRERRDHMAEFNGAWIAQPIGLVLVAYDTDGNGLVTVDELTAGAASEWRRMDTAGDGSVGVLAFSAWSEKYLGSANARPTHLAFDTNGNGSISEAEVRARLVAEFERLDTNGDGAVERSELVRQLNMPTLSRSGSGLPNERPRR